MQLSQIAYQAEQFSYKIFLNLMLIVQKEEMTVV